MARRRRLHPRGATPATFVVASLLLLALAGCLGPTRPVTPGEPPRAWEPAEPWLVRTTGCGFCGPATGEPVHELTAYDGDAGVLWARYARAGAGNETTVADAAMEPYRDVLAQLFGEISAYAVEDGRGVVVHEVHAGRLASSDADAVDRVLTRAIRHATPPGDPDFSGCADCAAVTMDALGGERAFAVRLNTAQGHEADSWGVLDEQLRLLADWVRGEARGGRGGAQTGGGEDAGPASGNASHALRAPWIVRSTGCGFCSGDPGAVEFHALVVDRAGTVVAIEYGRDDGFSVAPGAGGGAAAHAPAARELFQRFDLYGEGAGPGAAGARVHAMRAAAVPAVDFDPVRANLDAALAEAEDPGAPDASDCADCAATHVQVVRDAELAWDVRLLGNVGKGDPWLDVDRFLGGLDAWLAEQP